MTYEQLMEEMHKIHKDMIYTEIDGNDLFRLYSESVHIDFNMTAFPSLCMCMIMHNLIINYNENDNDITFATAKIHEKQIKSIFKFVKIFAAYHGYPKIIYTTSNVQKTIITLLERYGFEEMFATKNTNTGNMVTFWICNAGKISDYQENEE